jgi:hypothetical protein
LKKIIISALVFILFLGFFTPNTQAAVTSNTVCNQYKGVKKIWWNGVELKLGQIGRLIVLKNTALFKLNGNNKVFSRTLKAGEFYRIYAFKPGMLSVGGGYYVDRDTKVKYETPSKAKLMAVQCINKPYGKRSNPTNLGDGWDVKVTNWDGYKHYEISMVDVITDGNTAWQMIKDANMFNDSPPAGMKYILAKIRFKLFDAEEEPFHVDYLDFDAVSKNGVVYDHAPVVIPEPELSTDLYKGGETQGWAAFLVSENDVPLIVWKREYEDELWFKLK